MNVEHLEYFVTVAQVGSINKAAHALFISQPHLGKILHDLEDEVGVYIAQLLRDAEGQMHTLTGAHRTEGLLEVGVETIEQTRQKGSSFLKKSPGQRCHGALRYY